MNETIKTTIGGHVLIEDKQTGEILLDAWNAVHPQNMALAIARGLAHENNGHIYRVALGNGGTTITTGNVIVYNAPNTLGAAATLYNQTYEEVIDDAAPLVGVGNSVIAQQSVTPLTTSLIICTIQLSANEPAGQAPVDNVTVDPEAQFVFDELGLIAGTGTNWGVDAWLLTHLVFNPIEKTANRELILTYTLTASVS